MSTWVKNLDYWIILCWLCLAAIGLVAIYSATQGEAHQYLGGSMKNNFDRQLLWVGVAAVGMVIVCLIPVRPYMELAFVGYGVCILLLVAALMLGREVGGARSWVYIGSYGFQSSELAKVGTILAVARILSANKPHRTGNTSLIAVGLLSLPAVLIILQNDTGTALTFIGLIPVVLFCTGTSLWAVTLLLTPAIVGYLYIWYLPAAIGFAAALALALFFWYRDIILAGAGALVSGGTIATAYFAMEKLLQPHHVARIHAFANPEAEEFRSGVGFHLMQSKAAIGSGGLSGLGFMEGTQTQGAWIPEQSTDFIFSVIGEELGFLGAIGLLTCFALLLIRLVRFAGRITHPFASTVIACTAGLILLQVYINVGMVLGLLPVIGIPLPLVSYGGSAFLANSILLAIVLNLCMRRRELSLYA